MGLPGENDLLAITSAQITELNSKCGTHKELIVLNILNNKNCANESSDISKNLKLLTNWWRV